MLTHVHHPLGFSRPTMILHSRTLRIQVFLQSDTKLLPEWLELLEVLLVLALVLNLGLDTCMYVSIAPFASPL